MNNEERRFTAAVAAMQGLCANSSATIPARSYAEAAVSFADALLTELDRTKSEPKADSISIDNDGYPHPPKLTSPIELWVNVYRHGPIGVWRTEKGAKSGNKGAERVAVKVREVPTPRHHEYIMTPARVEEMLAVTLPGGNLCDPQSVADEIRNWFGYATALEPIPDADGWIPHRPGDPMPCDGEMNVDVKHADGDISKGMRAAYRAKRDGLNLSDWWTGSNCDPGCQIIAWKPATT